MKHSPGLLKAMHCLPGDSFFIRHDNQYVQVFLSEVIYIKAFKNYIRIVTPGKVYTPWLTMKQMETELPKNMFCRVHRSYIIGIKAITSFDHERVFLDTVEIPLGESHRQALMDKLKVIANDVRKPGKLSRMTVNDIMG